MRILTLSILLVLTVLAADLFAQKKPPVTRACGDPSAACSKRAMFSDEDIPFEYVEGAVVAETVPFYVVILKSAKLPQDGECEVAPKDFDRRNIQFNFLRNKVFIARGCYSLENNLYTNIGDNVIALAIYGGATKAQADVILKKVRSLDYLDAKDAYIIRIATGFNGT